MNNENQFCFDAAIHTHVKVVFTLHENAIKKTIVASKFNEQSGQINDLNAD